jgi:hypothetical protein
MEQQNNDVPAPDFGNTASFVAEPIGWLEAPHGTFRRNHSVSVTFPPQSVAWIIAACFVVAAIIARIVNR